MWDTPAPETGGFSTELSLLSRLAGRKDFFDKYELIEQVGQGGQGEIWKVWDFDFRRHVAMKRLNASLLTSEPVIYRFLAEAQIASQLGHPGILPIFDVGLDPDGKPYYTTQLLHGTTLQHVWHSPRGPKRAAGKVNQAVEQLVLVCNIMAYAHGQGVVHRDLKPSNILVGQFGDVRVIDWGSAFVLRDSRHHFEEPFVHLHQETIQTDRDDSLEAHPELATATSGHPVTTGFAAPEFLAGKQDAMGPETDVYSIGVILYEILTGRLPYADEDGRLPGHAELLRQMESGPPKPVRKIKRYASKDLSAITAKAVAHERSARYRTMTELAADLRAALELRPVLARKPTPALKLQRFVQRNAGYVVLVCLVVAAVAVGSFINTSVRRQRDVARQLQVLRNAELAARNGQWPDALKYWDQAQAAGYNDSIFLGLQRAEAWTVLNRPERAGAELHKLMRQSNLGERRGAVLLHLGDYEMFDKSTADLGAEHVRQSLAASLGPADRCVAEGLLAESVPEALDYFQEALKIDPYSYSAHVHSLAMELMLGHHADLAAHVHLFSVLYPQDPSAQYIEALEAAMAGRFSEIASALQPLQGSMTTNSWNQMVQGYKTLGAAAQCFDIGQLLGTNTLDSNKLRALAMGASGLISASLGSNSDGAPKLREPHPPCFEHGPRDGVSALQGIGSLMYKDVTPFVQQVKASWQLCPESVLPFRAATLLEMRQPRDGPISLSLLETQAEMFQMAADSESFVLQLPRTSRFLAARTEFKLVQSSVTNAPYWRSRCVRNLLAAAAAPDTTAQESQAYFDIALPLLEFDLAKQFLDRLDALTPNDTGVLHQRIELLAKSGNSANAVQLIEHQLAGTPNDPWMLAQERDIKTRLTNLLYSIELHHETTNTLANP